ncbi:hypothetical protein AAY72_07945 [Alishewanella sp. WH16-1]|uniref:hypothetical protein n=1 Tax=Alishewanella sp. WH16-1 TaxID=1651088 RepID=UPI00070C14EC|nr:hypothetical protein [Alishewanella sp. WH16-1]KRS21573.1 hypothetical protein AAY72_07945 [Alishewanella sp. WH16-1]
MKLLVNAVVSLTALFSLNALASNNSYVYSNIEYCQLQSQAVASSQLDAYARKLGFAPELHECRTLLQPQLIEQRELELSKQLRDLQRGSVIRINKKVEQKLAALPAAERAEVLKRFGLR